MKKLLLLLTIGLAAAADGQITTNAPRTNFELFNATPDALLVRGTSTIGVLNNQINFPVEIRIERLTNLRGPTTNTVYAVALRATVAQQIQVDYIDYDELDHLIHSIPVISQANNTIAPMDNYEVQLRTRSGWSIAKISHGNKTTIAMTLGDTNATRNQMAPFVLDDFGRYLVAAKTKIDAIAAANP